MTRAASVRPRTGERTRQDGLARTTTALERFRSVPPPPRILDRAREQEFTERQLEVFDKLGTMFESGFAELNMADLAKRLNCSLRTLYTLAPSRDDLMLSVVDRHLWEVGRAAPARDPRRHVPARGRGGVPSYGHAGPGGPLRGVLA